MAGKQAKILTDQDAKRLLAHVSRGPLKYRGRAMVLLSLKAGLRAGEIANLTWPMVMTADGRLNRLIELQDMAAKMMSGRSIPMHPELYAVLKKLFAKAERTGPVIVSDHDGGHLTPHSVVRWFRRQYRALGLQGCSSHSGRRTFVTTAARKLAKSGGSLRDVQELVGHKSLLHTMTYIEGDTAAKRKLVGLL